MLNTYNNTKHVVLDNAIFCALFDIWPKVSIIIKKVKTGYLYSVGGGTVLNCSRRGTYRLDVGNFKFKFAIAGCVSRSGTGWG